MIRCFIFVLSTWFLVGCNKHIGKSIDANALSVDKSWQSLTIREKIGQTMVVRAFRDDQVRQFGSIAQMMQKYPIGGIFIPYWDFLYKEPRSKVIDNIKSAIQEYQTAANLPMLVTEDFERGVGHIYYEYTHLPAEMALGAANNPKLAYDFGKSIALEAKDFGVNFLLHPLADLNMNPLQDLIVERAVSDDATLALPILMSQCDGIRSQGIIPTLKHFPGDGVTIKNQHLGTSTNTLNRKAWRKSFGYLYESMIKQGAPCIMVGHIRLPAFQKQKINGIIPPATLSSELLQGLLKTKMKFKGVIMSDALNMGGVGGYYTNELETAVAAFQAGVDLMLWPNLEFMDTVEARILRNEIPIERLNDAVQRIWKLREDFGLLTKKPNYTYTLTEDDKRFINTTATSVATNAITLVSSNGGLPITPVNSPHLAIINISHSDKTSELMYSVNLLSEKGFIIDTIMHNPTFFDWGHKLEFFNKFDRIIVAMENRYFSPLGGALLKDKEALAVWTMNMLPQEKLIAISYSNPYYVNLYFENARVKINAYSIDKFSQQAVINALTGKSQFKGKSPVQIKGLTF